MSHIRVRTHNINAGVDKNDWVGAIRQVGTVDRIRKYIRPVHVPSATGDNGGANVGELLRLKSC